MFASPSRSLSSLSFHRRDVGQPSGHELVARPAPGCRLCGCPRACLPLRHCSHRRFCPARTQTPNVRARHEGCTRRDRADSTCRPPQYCTRATSWSRAATSTRTTNIECRSSCVSSFLLSLRWRGIDTVGGTCFAAGGVRGGGTGASPRALGTATGGSPCAPSSSFPCSLSLNAS